MKFFFHPYPAAALGMLLCVGIAHSQADSSAVRDSSGSGFLPLPILFYAPENGLGVGGALLYVTRGIDNLRPSAYAGQLIYTTKKQVVVELQEDVYTAGGLYRADGSIHYSLYPQKFFGIGTAVPEGYEEQYSSETVRAYLDVVRKVTIGMNLGISTFYESRAITETEPGGLLAAGTLPGSVRGTSVGAGFLWTWDSRDNVFSTYRGAYHLINFKLFSPFFGSDFTYNRLSVDAREFYELSARHILAIQAYGIAIDGVPAFHKLAELGGANLLRGYYQGRYTDKNLLALQAEIRFPIWNRVSGASFAGTGAVADRFHSFSLSGIRTAFGAGLRYVFQEEERLVLRFDIGFGKNDSGVYIAAGEAF